MTKRQSEWTMTDADQKWIMDEDGGSDWMNMGYTKQIIGMTLSNLNMEDTECTITGTQAG